MQINAIIARGEAEFNKMNVLERQALADTIGISVGEMAKLVKKTGELETPKSFFDMFWLRFESCAGALKQFLG